MAEPIILTKEGKQKLIDELKDLKENQRPAILARLKEAREAGDLSENSDYDAARNQQGQTEARIRDIEYILNNATIVDEDALSNDSVKVGFLVTLVDLHTNKEAIYKIVGTTEADPFANPIKISNEAPLAKALLAGKGAKVGDSVSFTAPSGLKEFKVLKIEK